MISTMTGSINREVTPCQERLKASADCWLSLAAAPTFPIMALLTGFRGSNPPARAAGARRGRDGVLAQGRQATRWRRIAPPLIFGCMVVVAVSSTAA
jgi:hypothetical protein